MGLFQKNPFSTTVGKSLYTLGLSKTVLIVGLGNMGREYELTRHNAGFMTVDAFAETHSMVWSSKKDLYSHLALGNIGDTRVILVKPATMMNASGEAIQAVSHFYKVHTSDTVVVHDELDIDFGEIRCKTGGRDAGHNGIKSVASYIGKDFDRVRIGIGPKHPPQIDSADFVLAKFSDKEQANIPAMKREVTALLTEFVASGQLPTEIRSFIS